MIAAVNHTINYFKAPFNYFWHWAEKGLVIEWKNGSTICYTEDLVLLMKALTNSGVPSFGSVLLVLAACNGSWSSSSQSIGILNGLTSTMMETEEDSDSDVMEYYINQAVKCMDMIASLPEDLRKGMRRAHLLHEVFKDCKPAIEEQDLISAVDELRSGRLDKYVLDNGNEITREQYEQDLECLVKVFHKYAYVSKLEQQLRTGILEMPAPVLLELPEAKPGDLLDELSAEHRTAGIANLSRRIIAALNIPMHTSGSSDQSYGGVSDITNRGNYDKLLLSELAYDDNVLVARLANNEALYLRREEPPDHPKNKRVVLVDTSIKMWGVPRVFAMSVAIACTLNIKHKEEVQTYMLGGGESLPVDTTTVQGVMKGLEFLDPSLNCCNSLEAFLHTYSFSSKTDIIFITHHEALHDMHFQKLLGDYPDAISFIISIGRNGDMHFNEVVKGKTKLLSKAKFDLEDILFSAKPTKKKLQASNDLPAFFQQDKPPLLFPTIFRYIESRCIYNEKVGVIAVTESFRLLHWPSKNKGATEVLPFVEPGDYSFGFGGEQKFYLLINIYQSPKIILYALDIGDGLEARYEIETDKKGMLYGVYYDNSFYMRTNPSENSMVAIINCKNGNLEGSKPFDLCAHIFNQFDRRTSSLYSGNIKRHINNGYNVLNRFKTIAISLFGNISLGSKVISIPTPQTNHITIQQFEHRYKNESQKDNDPYSLESNQYCSLTNFTWRDGSKAIVDQRGILHFVSSDTSLPEVSIVLVEGKTTTCWSSDGVVAGNDYFLPSTKTNKLTAVEFYEKYFTPIIKRIEEA